MRRVVLPWIALAAWLVAGAAAAEAPRVVLLGAAEDDPIVVKVRDELRVLGVEVEFVPAPEEAGELAAVARARGADAVARVEAWPPEIVLWVAGAREGAREIRVSDALTGPVEPGLLALRAIELLRGGLLPVAQRDAHAAATSTGPGAPEAAPPRVLAAPEPSRPSSPPAVRRPDRVDAPAARRVAFFAGPALLAGAGGVPAALEMGVGAAWSLHPWAGLEAVAYAPTAPAKVSAAEGTVALHAAAFVAGGWASLTDPESDLRVTAGAGLGALLIVFDGEARAPWLPSNGSRWAALPYARVTGGYRFHPAASLRTDIAVGVARPEPVVRIAGREVASFGQPAILIFLGVEVRP
jgi:hypothetical protein